MAVATSAAIIGGLGLAKGAFDTISASKRQKQHQAELDAYQRQELTNTYKDMQISTIGSDAMREESSRNIATAMNSIGNAGTRAIIGATPKLVAEQNNVNRNIQKDLDDQVQKRNYLIANDDVRIQQMQEAREVNDLAGLGNAIDTARQDANTGINTMFNGIGSVASTMTGTIGGGGETAKTPTGSNSMFDLSKYGAKAPQMTFAPLQKTSFLKNNNFQGYPIPQTIGYNYKPLDLMPQPKYHF